MCTPAGGSRGPYEGSRASRWPRTSRRPTPADHPRAEDLAKALGHPGHRRSVIAVCSPGPGSAVASRGTREGSSCRVGGGRYKRVSAALSHSQLAALKASASPRKRRLCYHSRARRWGWAKRHGLHRCLEPRDANLEAWQERGNCIARAWQEQGKSMARTWQGHGNSMARTLQEHGKRMAGPWQ